MRTSTNPKEIHNKLFGLNYIFACGLTPRIESRSVVWGANPSTNPSPLGLCIIKLYIIVICWLLFNAVASKIFGTSVGATLGPPKAQDSTAIFFSVIIFLIGSLSFSLIK